jgi:hypothetical protein
VNYVTIDSEISGSSNMVTFDESGISFNAFPTLKQITNKNKLKREMKGIIHNFFL